MRSPKFGIGDARYNRCAFRAVKESDATRRVAFFGGSLAEPQACHKMSQNRLAKNVVTC